MQPSRISLTIRLLQRRFALQIERRRHARPRVLCMRRQVFAAAELAEIIAQQDHRGAGRLERARHGLRRVLEQADDAEHRRREDRAAFGFVVEADVAAGDRDVERPARVADAADRFADLPHDLRPLGIAEVEVVGRADRLAAGARDVARRLGDGEHARPGTDRDNRSARCRRPRWPGRGWCP